MLAMSDGTFAQRLAARRQALGWSKYRLAKESGLTEAYVGQLERGKSIPSGDALGKLAPAIGVTVEEMMVWADRDRLGSERVENVMAEMPAMSLVAALEAQISEVAARYRVAQAQEAEAKVGAVKAAKADNLQAAEGYRNLIAQLDTDRRHDRNELRSIKQGLERLLALLGSIDPLI